MHTRTFLGALLGLASAMLGGCTTTSNGVATSEMTADFTVHQTVDGATAKVEFHKGTPLGAFVELGSGDSISCNGAQLQKIQVGPAVWYSGIVGGNLPEGAAFVFQLVRTQEAYNPVPGNGPSPGYPGGQQTPADPNADSRQTFTTYVAAVKSLGVTEPAGGTTVHFAQALPVRWGNSGSSQQISVTLEGDCIDKIEDSGLEDTGIYTIDASKIHGKGTDSCDGKLTVTRFRNDPILGSGYRSAKSESYYDDVTKLTLAP